MTSAAASRVRAEVGLLALTLSAVIGMGRLFDEGSWLLPLAVNAVAAHLVVTLARRRGLSLPVAALVTALGCALVTTWTSYRPTTTLWLPTPSTWTAMRADLTQAWSLYQDIVAPAPVEPGFVLASAVAIWGVAYLADWAAFRIRVPFEATLPAGTLFLFASLLGAPAGREWAVALFAGAVLGFVLLHRVATLDETAHWVADRQAQGQRWLLVAGAVLASVAVAAGATLGPTLPGAESPGVLDPRSLGDGNPARVTISPLVDIRARLVDQSRVEVFRVRSPERAYWRLTALGRFDGRIWSSSGAYRKVDGGLPESVPEGVTTATFTQRFEIGALSTIWLPSAFEPRSMEIDGVDVLYEEQSATLIVDQGVDTSDGLAYEVTSASPRVTAADLAGAAGPVPDAIREQFLALPDDLSPAVRDLAATLTAGAGSPYEAALALQDHLRGFTYDLAVGPGHSADVLQEFLLVTKRGYCEQFAGAFAAMARSVGLPARVAVGFTFGEPDPTDPEVYVVRGEHAHAWPEVYLAGAGWVSFEPTPGRGMPFAEDYTRVPVAQAASDDPGAATTAPPTTDAGSAPTLPDGSAGPPLREEDVVAGLDGGSGAGGDDDAGPVGVVLRPLQQVAPFVALAVLAYLVLTPLGLALHRLVRRRRALTPGDRVALAWTEVAEEAELLGYRPVRSDTFGERTARVATCLDHDPEVPALARRLARHLEAAAYSEEGADDLDAQLADELSTELRRRLRDATSPLVRARRWVDLAGALRRARRGRLAHHRITTALAADREARNELLTSGDRR